MFLNDLFFTCSSNLPTCPTLNYLASLTGRNKKRVSELSEIRKIRGRRALKQEKPYRQSQREAAFFCKCQ